MTRLFRRSAGRAFDSLGHCFSCSFRFLKKQHLEVSSYDIGTATVCRLPFQRAGGTGIASRTMRCSVRSNKTMEKPVRRGGRADSRNVAGDRRKRIPSDPSNVGTALFVVAKTRRSSVCSPEPIKQTGHLWPDLVTPEGCRTWAHCTASPIRVSPSGSEELLQLVAGLSQCATLARVGGRSGA